MKKNNHRFKYNFTFFVLLISLAAYSFLSIFFFHHERLTGDATLYISIAEKYIRGDFSNAVNGYWGPLLSWLLIPFLSLGSSHLFAINALNLIFGLLAITGIWRLSYRFEISENIRAVTLLPLVPVLLFISLIQPMDFLLLSILLYYLNVVFSKDYPDKLSNAALGGLLGAFAYFAKPFGFPFFISHFLLINTCHYFKDSSTEHKKNVLRSVLVGFVVFSLLSGIWIALISKKYDHITFSNMGRGVFAALGPGSKHDTLEKGDPVLFKGFFEPPNETAYVIYEDPSFARKETWSPLESRGLFKHFMSNFMENIFEILRIYESYSRLSIAIVIAYILLLFTLPVKKIFSRGEILYPFLTVTLYTSGYIPFHLEARYLWIVNVLLLLMGGKVLNELFKGDFFKNNSMKNILSVLFVISFIVTPLKSTIEMSKKNINKEMYILGRELGKRYDIKGNIASNRLKVETLTHDSWHQTYRLAYWLKSRYYGQAKGEINDVELENELNEFDIDYYFFWGEPYDIPDFLSKYREITDGEIPALWIYSLKEKSALNKN